MICRPCSSCNTCFILVLLKSDATTRTNEDLNELVDVESHNDDSKCNLHVPSLMINCGQMRGSPNYLVYMG